MILWEHSGSSVGVRLSIRDLFVGVWGPTAHPGLPLEVFFGRTVLLIVAQWFVQDTREMVDNFLQV